MPRPVYIDLVRSSYTLQSVYSKFLAHDYSLCVDIAVSEKVEISSPSTMA